MARSGRLLLALAICAALAAAFSGRASAAWSPCPPSQSTELQTAHFNIWYDNDKTKVDYATETQAGDMAAFGEQAYAAMTALGFPAPVTDSSGKIQISIVDPSPGTWREAICHGSASVSYKEIGAQDEAYTMGVLVFQLIEENTWEPDSNVNLWPFQGAAAWASYKTLGYPGVGTSDLGPLEMSLDCFDNGTGQKCSKVAIEDDGETRWPFYEYLAQRFGTSFITRILKYGASANSALRGLQDALSTENKTVADVYTDFVVRQMTGGWGITSLDNVVPTVTGAPLFTGAVTADLGSRVVSVDHLAARYVEFDRGDGSAGHPCFAAALTINVALPFGVGARPYFFWNVKGSTPVALSINGNLATTTVPWDTCLWPSNRGYLALPNPATTSAFNSVNFTVTSHLTVDTSTQVNVVGPPSPVPVWGQVVPVPTTDGAPSIEVFGPELLRVSATDRVIRLIVQSSGPGAVQATLGSSLLGNASLRAGNNDLRFAVPASLIAALRRWASVANTLTLTPVASSGATGQPVTREVTITAARKKK
ncbi:MAG TPA: hypothetical protein VFM96_05925 [Gaiellaceae bacterium]|nr:hypothetical protein [Gaiellaceae bacterium]